MEKMEALAWEEAFMANNAYAKPIIYAHLYERSFNYCSTTGIHLELIHLEEELSKRSDKPVELAPQRRMYEMNDKCGVNWWKVPPCSNAHILGTDILCSTNVTTFNLKCLKRT